MRLIPEQGANVKWYQYPFAFVVGLYRIFVKGERLD